MGRAKGEGVSSSSRMLSEGCEGSGPPKGQGLSMLDVLWGPGTGGGRALQNVNMSYSCIETTPHSGTSWSSIDFSLHYLPIFSFDIRLKS